MLPGGRGGVPPAPSRHSATTGRGPPPLHPPLAMAAPARSLAPMLALAVATAAVLAAAPGPARAQDQCRSTDGAPGGSGTQPVRCRASLDHEQRLASSGGDVCVSAAGHHRHQHAAERLDREVPARGRTRGVQARPGWFRPAGREKSRTGCNCLPAQPAGIC